MNSVEFANKFTFEQKKVLRSIRTVERKLEMDVDSCCMYQPAAMQFVEDCRMYGLFEASLYAIGYVRKGWFTEAIGEKLLVHCIHALTPKPKATRKPRTTKPKLSIDDLL